MPAPDPAVEASAIALEITRPPDALRRPRRWAGLVVRALADPGVSPAVFRVHLTWLRTAGFIHRRTVVSEHSVTVDLRSKHVLSITGARLCAGCLRTVVGSEAPCPRCTGQRTDSAWTSPDPLGLSGRISS